MPADFLSLLDRRVVILDGAMGTSIHRFEPSVADWGGDKFVNLSDHINLTHPEWIVEIHRSFLRVGCDAVETNTFNGSKHVLAEFGVAADCYALNKLGAELARSAVDEFTTREHPRFVIGSVGPGTKTPSLLNPSTYLSFDDHHASHCEQMRGLIDGGVDVLLIETCYDILQAKSAIIAALDVMHERGVRLPLMVQVTIERNGTMLPGTEMAAALTTLQSFPEIDVIGLNCATGPDLMLSSIRFLSEACTRRISCLPNAGLPENIDGKTHFPLQPAELASWLGRFVRDFGVNIVGGCCGTTPEHLAAVVQELRDVQPKPRQPRSAPAVSSLFQSIDLHQEPRPLLVGALAPRYAELLRDLAAQRRC